MLIFFYLKIFSDFQIKNIKSINNKKYKEMSIYILDPLFVKNYNYLHL